MKKPSMRPHHAIIGLGVLIALFTALSGVAASVFKFHDDSPVTREVFENIPGSIKFAFYLVIPLVLIYGSVLFANRVKNWERGTPDNRSTNKKNAKARFSDFRAGVYMKTLLRDPAAGVMHSLMYFPFLILLAVTTTLEINHQLPESIKFLHGDVYRAYTAVGDIAGTLFLIGVVWALIRRYGPKRFRPYRIRIKSKPEHAVVLLIFLSIGVTGFGAEAFRIALVESSARSAETWSIIGYPLAKIVDSSDSLTNNVHGWHQFWWIAHVISFIAFLALLPITMLRHMFTSPLNMYLKDRERPKGAMKPLPNLMETELETFGASVIEDFTWKQLLDTDSCTMCGRCTSVCPAHATGKPLDPREIILKTGEV
ncbi:MAG: iron-sulfur protein, partial [Acidimicrobiaceae bacterium]|nr:iron-sulfur protein [Acidimicrobiaceae bacterium]